MIYGSENFSYVCGYVKQKETENNNKKRKNLMEFTCTHLCGDGRKAFKRERVIYVEKKNHSFPDKA